MSRGAASLKTHTLLQRNMFAGILRATADDGLPLPPGDAPARFREDPPTITLGSMDGVRPHRTPLAVVAAAVMWRVDRS